MKKTLANVADRDEVLRRLDRLRPDSKRQWGLMTAHQMLCHLGDSYLVPIGQKKASEASSLLQRTVIKWVALNSPMPWPHGFKTRPELEQGFGGTPPEDFDRDRNRVKELTCRFCRPQRDFQFHPHPIFGSMTDAEWLRWGYLHADHHLRQFGE